MANSGRLGTCTTAATTRRRTTPYFATVYTLAHLGLPPALQKNIRFGFYESGHMVHLNPATIGKFKSDLAKWYDDALAGR